MRSTGRCDLHGAGRRFRSAGLTLRAFNKALTAQLGQYMKLPRVSAEVVKYRPFYIVGEIKTLAYPYRMLLKDRAGVWHLPKRMAAGEAVLSDSLKRRYELRQEIAAASHGVVKATLQGNSVARLRSLLAEHERLSMGSRKRIVESVKSARWPLYFRVRPPRLLYDQTSK